jgi:hypothetical protein
LEIRKSDFFFWKSGNPEIRKAIEKREMADVKMQHSFERFPKIRKIRKSETKSGNPEILFFLLEIRESGNPEIRESENPTIRKSENKFWKSRNLEIRKSGNPEIWKSGNPGIRKSENPEIRK